MKPEEMRKTLAAKQRPAMGEELTPNGIDFLTNPEKGLVMFRFHHATNNFVLDQGQLVKHIDALILAAKDLKIKFTGEIKWEA